MNKRSVLFAILMITALLAGCGGQPAEPTMSVADVQSTAVSAAFTIVAETQAAIPTNTPLPPTETPTFTPAATNTPLPFPTLAATLTNTPSAGGDFCSTRALSAPKGKETRILIDNKTKYPVQVSLYLNRTELDECGYRGYNIGKNGSVLITDLVYGCYDLWAWSTDPKKPFQVASGTSCINNPDKWTFQITEETIKFVGP